MLLYLGTFGKVKMAVFDGSGAWLGAATGGGRKESGEADSGAGVAMAALWRRAVATGYGIADSQSPISEKGTKARLVLICRFFVS